MASAMGQGLVLALLTHSETLTADPRVAVELCQAVHGLGLTLDPSHFLQGPRPHPDYDAVFPYVQNVHLRDTGQAPGEFQVRVGQGQVEYARIVAMLQRHGYNRALTVAIIDRPTTPSTARSRSASSSCSWRRSSDPPSRRPGWTALRTPPGHLPSGIRVSPQELLSTDHLTGSRLAASDRRKSGRDD